MAAVPGTTGLLAIPIVGEPPIPFPVVTLIWSAVPTIVVAVTVVPLTVNRPTAVVLEMFCKSWLRPITGFAETPSPSDTVMPEPTVIERFTTVLALSLTMNPVLAAFKLDAAPVILMRRVVPAPLSVRDRPVLAVR